MKISRRKNSKPAKNATMAATKNRATGTGSPLANHGFSAARASLSDPAKDLIVFM